MNMDLTEIVCVFDRSGSMEVMRDDAIGGFNAFIDGQKQLPGQANLTLVLFDDEYLLVHDAVPLAQVPPLTRETFVPRGSTALLDAIGRTIEDIGRRLAATPESERPGKVIVAIMTDGEENSSKTFNHAQVALMIRGQEQVYSWEFLFLAADIDVIATAARLNIRPSNARYCLSGPGGGRAAYAMLGAEITARRNRRENKARKSDS